MGVPCRGGAPIIVSTYKDKINSSIPPKAKSNTIADNKYLFNQLSTQSEKIWKTIQVPTTMPSPPFRRIREALAIIRGKHDDEQGKKKKKNLARYELRRKLGKKFNV